METTARIDKVSGGDKAKLYHIIQDMGKKEFDRQKGYVDKYLKENIFMGNVAIVDIGWSGTMQKALQTFTKTTNVSLQGYYLGVRNIASDEQYTGLSRQGYLFNNIRNEKFNLMTRFTTEIIELLFSNREGSVLKYDFANGHIVPVLDDVEYGEKEDLFIKDVQKAALDFLKAVERDKFLIREEKIPEDIVMKAYYRFAVQPALSVLEIFKNFQVLNGKVRSILPEHGILYYMVHIRKLKQDFEESSCKILFLKEIFKVNLPYFEILERLLSKYDNERAK